LPEGPLEVTASAKGYAALPDAVAIDGSEGPSLALAATLRLAKGFSLAGRVVFSDGSPAARADVTHNQRGVDATTDAAGAFQFEDLPDGKYSLRATLTRDDDEFAGTAEAAAGQGDV